MSDVTGTKRWPGQQLRHVCVTDGGDLFRNGISFADSCERGLRRNLLHFERVNGDC
ncbi:hypothetical protein HPP92_023766, partial [Vanilla planifolia]